MRRVGFVGPQWCWPARSDAAATCSCPTQEPSVKPRGRSRCSRPAQEPSAKQTSTQGARTHDTEAAALPSATTDPLQCMPTSRSEIRLRSDPRGGANQRVSSRLGLPVQCSDPRGGANHHSRLRAFQEVLTARPSTHCRGLDGGTPRLRASRPALASAFGPRPGALDTPSRSPIHRAEYLSGLLTQNTGRGGRFPFGR